jgi:hypothetical protein
VSQYLNTRLGTDLHPPLTKFQKEATYFGIEVFNHLPPSIKNLSREEIQLRLDLKWFLLINTFYTLDEYFNWKLSTELGSL